MRITVSGRNLATSSLAQVRGPRLLIPIVPVALELGYAINVDTQTETVQVRRAGIDATFVKQSAEIRENGSVVAALPGMPDISFPPDKTNLLLPIEVVAPLLGVSVTIDREQNVIRIEPEAAALNTTTDSPRGRLEVAGAEYNYGVNLIAGQMSQSLNLSSSGRIGDTKYFASGSLAGGAGGPLILLRGGNITLIRPKDQQIQVGDFSTGSDLLLTSTGLRGLGYEQSINQRMKMAFFGGKAISGTQLRSGEFALPRYDMTMFGGRFTFSPNKAVPGTINQRSLFFTVGSNIFTGAGQNGQIFDSSFRYNTKINQFDAEAALGNFHGTTTENQSANGIGSGIVIDDTFTPWQPLTLQGRYSRFSPNFLTPQRAGQYNNQQSFSFGAGLHVNNRFYLGGSASSGDSLTIHGRATRSYNFNGSYDPAERYLPRLTVTYSDLTGVHGNFSVAQLNLSREFAKWRPFANVTIARGTGLKSDSFTIGSSFITERFGTFQAVQTFGSGTSGSFDWYPIRPLFDRIQLSGGIGYVDSNHRTTPLSRVLTSIRLPGKQTFQFSYTRTSSNSEMRWSMAGPLAFWRTKNDAVAASSTTIITDSTVQGRIYLDANRDNQFDGRVDQPAAGITVMLDSTHTTITDSQGNYRFERIPAGVHTLSINLYDVRADLIPASNPLQTVMIAPRRILTSDFRLVRSGRISGRIWQDLNGNGQYDEGEPTLPNVRIITSGGRDTYSDIDGTFLLSDLPPGEQTIFLDQRTLPGELLASITEQQIPVKPGQETAGINFIFKQRPRGTQEKQFPGKESAQTSKP